MIFAVIVIVSPIVGIVFEKVMSEDEIERLGFTLASARRAKAVEYGSSDLSLK